MKIFCLSFRHFFAQTDVDFKYKTEFLIIKILHDFILEINTKICFF